MFEIAGMLKSDKMLPTEPDSLPVVFVGVTPHSLPDVLTLMDDDTQGKFVVAATKREGAEGVQKLSTALKLLELNTQDAVSRRKLVEKAERLILLEPEAAQQHDAQALVFLDKESINRELLKQRLSTDKGATVRRVLMPFAEVKKGKGVQAVTADDYGFDDNWTNNAVLGSPRASYLQGGVKKQMKLRDFFFDPETEEEIKAREEDAAKVAATVSPTQKWLGVLKRLGPTLATPASAQEAAAFIQGNASPDSDDAIAWYTDYMYSTRG
jgi:hypothetical protein